MPVSRPGLVRLAKQMPMWALAAALAVHHAALAWAAVAAAPVALHPPAAVAVQPAAMPVLAAAAQSAAGSAQSVAPATCQVLQPTECTLVPALALLALAAGAALEVGLEVGQGISSLALA